METTEPINLTPWIIDYTFDSVISDIAQYEATSTKPIEHLVYKITNIRNNLVYIGTHSGSADDNYMGSGKYIRKAIKTFGKQMFRKDIICYCKTEAEAATIESVFVTKDFIRRRDTYNATVGGGGKPSDRTQKQKYGVYTLNREDGVYYKTWQQIYDKAIRIRHPYPLYLEFLRERIRLENLDDTEPHTETRLQYLQNTKYHVRDIEVHQMNRRLEESDTTPYKTKKDPIKHKQYLKDRAFLRKHKNDEFEIIDI